MNDAAVAGNDSEELADYVTLQRGDGCWRAKMLKGERIRGCEGCGIGCLGKNTEMQGQEVLYVEDLRDGRLSENLSGHFLMSMARMVGTTWKEEVEGAPDGSPGVEMTEELVGSAGKEVRRKLGSRRGGEADGRELRVSAWV